MLSGAVFVPLVTKASLLSFIGLGNEASANDSLPPSSSSANSQNIALLEPAISGVSIIQDKKDPDAIKDDAGVNIVSENALLPATGPLGANTDNADNSLDQVSVYVVKQGDSITGIAKMFEVTPDTIWSANDMKKGDKAKVGDVLVIPNSSGVEYTIKKGDTLPAIAKTYKVDTSDIAFANGISENTKLVIGNKLMIPDAVMADEGGDKPAPNLGLVQKNDENYYATHFIQNLIGFFINPVPAGRKTQGLHGPGHRGIDIGAPTGTNIYASASGTVVAVKTGCVVGRKRCGGGYGNFVKIEHPNGTATLYGHMIKVSTSVGEYVNQGDIIGHVGSTGASSGPHTHFEVFNAKNPGADWSWKI